mgnify:CR=1 FL=1
MTDNTKLLEKVKKYLHVTWNDEDDDLKELIEEAKQYLNEKTGTAIEYEKDLVALGLLKDYCRYTRNYSKEYFEQNFLNEIQNLQFKYAINEKTENSDEWKS